LYQWTIEKERDFQNRSAALHQNLERAMGENQSLRDELAKLRGERLSVDKLLAEAQAGREQADKDLQTARAGNRQLNALLVAQQTRMLIVQLSEFRNQPRTAWAERLTPLIPAGPAEGEGGHYLRAMWLDFQGDGNHYADALRSVPANDPWAKLAQVELAGLAGNPTPMIEWLAQVEGDLRGARPAQPQNLDLQLAKRLVCQQAAVRLHQQGRPILPALFHALQSNQLTTRLASLATLSLLGPEATPAVNTVMGFLHDDAPPELAAQSAYFLGQVGPGAARAMEALARLAQHGSPEVRDAANKAMAAIQGRR
jgi:hypothetical protein